MAKKSKNSVNCGLTYDRIKAIEGGPLFLKACKMSNKRKDNKGRVDIRC